MFKAFLRTDGAVVVSGGDPAWQFQRKQFQRLVTKVFVEKLKALPATTTLAEFNASERTIVCDVYEFMDLDAPRVTDNEYHHLRAVLREVVERREGNPSERTVAS